MAKLKELKRELEKCNAALSPRPPSDPSEKERRLGAAADRMREPVERAWQPIETAPWNGTRILVYRPGSHNYPEIGIDLWQTDFRRVSHACWEHSPDDGQPTHWMPLPEPPK